LAYHVIYKGRRT